MKEDFKQLHEMALKAAEKYLDSESDLIEILQRMDRTKAYRKLHYKSLSDYAIQALKLSASVAFNMITVARKAVEVPALQDRIRRREITLSNARKIAPVITPKNQETWLRAAATLSKSQLEKRIAQENPKLAVSERVTYVSAERLEFKIGISEELHFAILRAQELLSSKLKKAAGLEETLAAMTELYLEREDPVRRARRVRDRKAGADSGCEDSSKSVISAASDSDGGDSSLSMTESRDNPAPSQATPENKATPPTARSASAQANSQHPMPPLRQKSLRSSSITPLPPQSPADEDPDAESRYIPADLKNALLLRDQGQCTHIGSNGVRCQERRWLDIHHILPISMGGKTTLENLTTLCRGHHQMIHAHLAPWSGKSDSPVPGQVKHQTSDKFPIQTAKHQSDAGETPSEPDRSRR